MRDGLEDDEAEADASRPKTGFAPEVAVLVVSALLTLKEAVDGFDASAFAAPASFTPAVAALTSAGGASKGFFAVAASWGDCFGPGFAASESALFGDRAPSVAGF